MFIRRSFHPNSTQKLVTPNRRYPSVSQLDELPFGPPNNRQDQSILDTRTFHKHKTPSLLQNLCGQTVMCPSKQKAAMYAVSPGREGARS